MSDYPRRHEREAIVCKASNDLSKQLIEMVQELELTEGEQLRVCGEVYANWISGMAKYMIRDERHGNTSTPGGLAPTETVKKEFDIESFLKESEPPPANQ